MLEDTSFAIHPGKEQQERQGAFYDIGHLLEVKRVGDFYECICDHAKVWVRFYTDKIVRIVMDPNQEATLTKSRAVTVEPDTVQITEENEQDAIVLKTSDLTLHIKKSPFRITVKDQSGQQLLSEEEHGMAFNHDGGVAVFKKMEEEDHFYGFGEKTGFLDKRGEKFEMWNTDVYAPHNPETDPLYESIPYFMTLRNGKAHGVFFDNTFRTFFDMQTYHDRYSFRAEGGQLNYYVLAGSSPKAVLEQYTYLTGRMPLPPKWALGYHQSRYSYETEEEVRELAQQFIEKDIPVDAIHLDIHYMKGYRVFTFDKDRFGNPEKLVKDLRKLGIRIVPIVDPGVKKDTEYPIYQAGIKQDLFCKYIDGEIYTGDVWPGESAFPDFTDEKVRKWWADNHHFYTDIGIEGIWNDMNEPAVFNEIKTMDIAVMHRNDGEPTTHRELHNVYGLLMGEATYDGLKKQLNGKRPFLLTRAGYAGVQRYAAVWTGDNRSFWEHLQMSLPMVMNLGLSGVPFTGPDVGGFAHDTNAELLTRWTQVGVFTPYFRNHSAIGFRYQEPWQFGEKYEAIIQRYIQMRYEWMPQLYSLFHEASDTGTPVMRPLFMEFPEDGKTYNLHDQFMIGDNVIIAPILAPSVTSRAVYLPDGEWVELTTGNVLAGAQTHLAHAALEELPIFVRNGSVIMKSVWVSNQDKTPQQMCMNLFAKQTDAMYHFTFYDDDGETFSYENGVFLKMEFEVVCTADVVKVTTVSRTGDFVPAYEHIDLRVIGLAANQQLLLDGVVVRDNGMIPIVK